MVQSCAGIQHRNLWSKGNNSFQNFGKFYLLKFPID